MNQEYTSLNLLIASKKKEISKYVSLKNTELKPLLDRHAKLTKDLYVYMKLHGLDNYGGISIDQVTPKEKKKKDNTTREGQIKVLREMGIRNPSEAMKELGLDD